MHESQASGSDAPRPNFLILFPDQHRGDWLGRRATLPVRTPNVDALAARGTDFVNALCPSPLCSPSRAALATGLDHDRNPVKRNEHDLPLDHENVYRRLRDSGYHVATCGKLDLLKERKDWGADGTHTVDGRSLLDTLGFSAGVDSAGKHDGIIASARGLPEPYFTYLERHQLREVHLRDFERRRSPSVEAALGLPERPYDRGDGSRPPPTYTCTEPTPLPAHAYVDNWIAARGLDLLDAAPADRPWLLQVNFNGPHEPMDVTGEMRARWDGVDFPLPPGLADLPAPAHRQIRRNYAAMIENVDRLVGDFIGWLERAGQLERTVVVYASDHGEMLGEQRLWEKHVPYQPSVHVPLVVAGPGVAAGAVVHEPAATVDLPATLMDLAGVERLASGDSRSLAPVLDTPGGSGRELAFSALGCWRLAFDGRYKLVLGYEPGMSRGPMLDTSFDAAGAGSALLFDLEADPAERYDMTGTLPHVRARLEEALRAWVAGD